MTTGWRRESARHALARKGIVTGRKKKLTIIKIRHNEFTEADSVIDQYHSRLEDVASLEDVYEMLDDYFDDEFYGDLYYSFAKNKYKKEPAALTQAEADDCDSLANEKRTYEQKKLAKAIWKKLKQKKPKRKNKSDLEKVLSLISKGYSAEEAMKIAESKNKSIG